MVLVELSLEGDLAFCILANVDSAWCRCFCFRLEFCMLCFRGFPGGGFGLCLKSASSSSSSSSSASSLIVSKTFASSSSPSEEFSSSRGEDWIRPVLERLFPLEELGGFGNSQSLLPFLHPETVVLVFPLETSRTVYSLLSHTGLVSSH
jgi:hypothetical protein